jgi:hypothetical protein
MLGEPAERDLAAAGRALPGRGVVPGELAADAARRFVLTARVRRGRRRAGLAAVGRRRSAPRGTASPPRSWSASGRASSAPGSRSTRSGTTPPPPSSRGSTPRTSCTVARCGPWRTSTRSSGGPPPDHAGGGERRRPRYSRAPDRAVLVTAPGGGRRAPPEAGWRRRSERAVTGRAGRARGHLSDAPLLAELPPPGRVVAADTVRSWAWCAGRSPTAHGWCCSPPTSATTRSSSPGQRRRHLAPAGLASSCTGARPRSPRCSWAGRRAVAHDLQRRLAGKAASVGTFVSDLAQGMNGFAAPADLETLFQLAAPVLHRPAARHRRLGGVPPARAGGAPQPRRHPGGGTSPTR